MTLAELYAALEKLEGGKDLVAGFKGEISRINEVAKADRLKFEKTITDLTSARDELKGKVDEYEAHKGEKSPEILALEKQIKGLTDKYEQSEKARQAEIEKRTNSEISAQTIAALTKANCTDAETFSKLIAGQISVQEDGTIGTIEECATAFLADKPYAVKTTQNGGSGAGAGNANDGNGQLAEMYKIAGIKPPSEG